MRRQLLITSRSEGHIRNTAPWAWILPGHKDVSFRTLVNIPGFFVPFLDAITRLISKSQRFMWEDILQMSTGANSPIFGMLIAVTTGVNGSRTYCP